MAFVFDPYRPRPEWFAHDPAGIHGISHVSRVLVWAEQVGAWMQAQGRPVDLEVVRLAAVTHDVGRFDDGRDPEHGRRSASWVRRHREALPAPLDEARIEAVAYCCTWHVPPDAHAPLMTNELICLKDADALDRVRIGDLDPRRLRTPQARRLPGAARRLLDASTRPRDGEPWERVRGAAQTLGLWR
jgi:HD domain